MKSEKVNFGRRKAFTLSVLFAVLTFAIVSIGCASADLNDGLIAYYPFNGNANDESGNGNHGTVHGASLTTDRLGKPDSAYEFDGVDDYVEVPHSSTLNITSKLTISAWIRLDSLSKWVQGIVEKRVGHDTQYSIYVRNYDEVGFYFQGGSVHQTNGVNLQTGQWYHVASVFDTDANNVKIYVDGVQKLSEKETGEIISNTNKIRIGRGADSGEYFNGIIDEVRIYNRALTETEIKELYNLYDGGDVATPKKGLVGYWKFDEGSGNTARDSSGKGNDGTIQGATRVDGRCKKALSFDGGAYVEVPNSNSLNLVDELTIEAWVKPTNWGGAGYGRIVNKENAYCFHVTYSEYGKPNSFSLSLIGIVATATADSNSVILNEWNHLVTVWDGSDIRFYSRGILVGTTHASGTIPTTSNPFLIGNDEANTRQFNGIIDEVRIYNYARSPSEILGDMKCSPSTPMKPLLCTYPDSLTHDFGSVPEDQTRDWGFDITNCGEGKLTWTVSDDQSWITVNPTSGSTTTETDTVTVSIDTSGLECGKTYTGTITVSTDGGTKQGTITVYVPEPGEPALWTDPDSLTHDFGSVPEDQTREWTFDIKNGGEGTLTWTVSDNRDWITVNPTSGSTTTETDTVTVSIDTTGLECGKKYTGTITVSSDDGETKQGTITVYVPKPGEPALWTDPDSLTHNFGSVPEGQSRKWSFDITNCGEGTLTWTVSADPSWITVNPTSGSTTTETDTVTVSIDTTGLECGKKYTGTITVSSDGETKQGTITVYVPEPGEPLLCTYPDSLTHDFGTVPEGQSRKWSFDITNCGAGTLTWTVSADRDWITVNPTSGSTTTETDTVTVSIDTTDLECGKKYTGTIKVSSDGETKQGTITVYVPEPGEPALCTYPDSLTHDFGSVPEGQTRKWTFDITNCGAGTLTWTFSDDREWITVSQTSGSTTTEADTVTVSIDTTGLECGKKYTGTITVSSDGETKQGTITVYVPEPGVFPPLFYPIIYENNWNADTWGYTDTTTWTICKDTLYYSNRHGYVLVKQIVIWYEWDLGEESVSYVLEKDGVEYQKGEFIKGGCLSSNSQWCYGRDTLRFYTDMFFPAGTYVLKLTKSKMAQNSGSNGDGFVKLLGPLNPKTADLFYDSWNPHRCYCTDISTWTLNKDTFIEEIGIYANWYPDESCSPSYSSTPQHQKTFSYEIMKDSVEFCKGNFIKGPCHSRYTYWCMGSDTPNMVFPAGTYVMKLSKTKQCQNSGSNGNGYVRLFGSAVKGTSFDDTIALSDGQTLSRDIDKDEEVYYRFYLSTGQQATVRMQPLEGDQDLYIFNPKRHPIEVSGNSGTETEECTVTADTGGWYYAKVHGYEAGSYTITLPV